MRHVTRTATSHEEDEIQALISVDSESAETLEEIRILWDIAKQPDPSVDSRLAWERIRGDIEMDAKVTPITGVGLNRTHAGRRTSRSSGLHMVRLAAVLGFATLLSTASLWLVLNPEQEVHEQPSQVFVTQKGQRATTQLPDGTLVQLQAGSQMEVPSGFSDNHRQILLEGEAYFDVARDADLPFLVQTSLTNIEAVGTAFGVRAFPADGVVHVAVTQGSVALHLPARADTLLLRPRDLGIVRLHHSPLVERNVDLARYLAWTEGYLVFEDAAFSEVAAELERWYDLQIELVGSSTASVGLTAVFGSESLSEILGAISIALDLNYERDQRRITFYPARARAH